MSTSSKLNIVGIDLGTTNSEIFKVVYGKPEPCVGPNQLKITPSRVVVDSRSNGETVKFASRGSAKNVVRRNPENEIYEVKRVIGRKFNDDYVKRDVHFWPFTIIEGEDGLPYYQVSGDGRKYLLSAVDIDAQILRTMKSYVKEGVDNAVITVPSYFSTSQIEDTRKAGELAGFNVKRIIPEPVAAAIAYGNKVGSSLNNHRILVYDLGGGTFDCCIVQYINNQYKVLAKDGHSHLGGADFDNALVKYFCQQYKKAYNIDLYESKSDLNTLKVLAEDKKKLLSDDQIFEIDFTIEPVLKSSQNKEKLPTLTSKLTREEFENLISKSIKKTIGYIDDTIKNLSLTSDNIDDIVCVGGSTRIPLVKKSIQEYFKRDINFNIVDIDCAVAEGAAIYADSLEKGVDLLYGSMETIPEDDPYPQPDPIWRVPYNIYFNYGEGYVLVFPKDHQLVQVSADSHGVKESRRNRNINRQYDNMASLDVDIFTSTDDTAEKEILESLKLHLKTRCPKTDGSFSICFKYNSKGELQCELSDRKGSKLSTVLTCRDDALDEREIAILRYQYKKQVTQMIRDSVAKGNTKEEAEKRTKLLEFLDYLDNDGAADNAQDLENTYNNMFS